MAKIGIGSGSSPARRKRRFRTPSLELLEARLLLQGNPSHSLNDDVYQHLVIRINGQPVDIPANIGVGTDGELANPHTHDADGVLHQHPINGQAPTHYATIGDFFQVWQNTPGQLAGNNPNAVFNANQLLQYQTDDEHIIRMFVNGVERDEYENYTLWNGDQIVLSYESLPDYPAPLINPINDVTMPAGHTFVVPIDASARGHGPLTFEATSTDPNLVLEPLWGGPSVRLTVQIESAAPEPAADFLLQDLNPNSDTFQEDISLDTFQGEVAAYYFTNPG